MVTHRTHENLAMDGVAAARTGNSTMSHHHHRRGGVTLSCGTIIILAAFFLCTLATVSFVVYNASTCDQLPIPGPDEDVICTTVHMRHKPNETNLTADPNIKKYETNVRLPHSIKPLKYNISLEPYLYEGNFTFDGKVQIHILALEDSYNITMHAVDLNILKNDVSIQPLEVPKKSSDKTSVSGEKTKNKKEPLHSKGADDVAAKGSGSSSTTAPSSQLRIRKQYLLEAKQFFVIELYDKVLKNTEYVINIQFSGLIQDFLQGFYRSSYRVLNETRWLASTQFQATDARRAFPCFDEPALKANFTLHIARPANMSTVSNMPIVKTEKHATLPNYEWDHYAESLPMSTYLVAYSISDFAHLSDGNFSVWARQDAIQSAKYALSVGPKILKFLETFFDLPFPLPKMDMIALPDFQAGAMENWGLITFRETTMLFEEGVSAATYKQRVAAVVGHELAHQWFGNLVTPSWWSDIWLNEGFASYMEYITMDAIHPEWRTMDQFVVNELQNVFQLDALSTSHKISVEVQNPDEITEIFDRISYGKGSTIIRMMSHFLTSKVFRRGLSNYLKEMAYNSAEQDDLWRFLTMEAKASGLLDRDTTVKDIMDTWTLQVGFPVVYISKHPNTNVIRLEQQRFVYENKTNDDDDMPGIEVVIKGEDEEESLWWIPITYTTSEELDFENTRPLTWIPRTKIYEIENQNLSNAEWFIFNIKQSGYYRINYEQQNWQNIIDHLMDSSKFRDIAPSNRAQLIDDAMNLARGGYLSYEVAMNMTRYLAFENDHAPWKAAVNAFNFLDSMFIGEGDYDVFKNYLLKLIDHVYNDLGFVDAKDENNMLEHYKRSEILSMACYLGHQKCIAESVRHFQNFIQVPNPDSNNPISPNLRIIVYCTAVQYGTEAEWNFAFERYLKTSVSTEKEILLSALGCTKEPWILARYLRYAIAGDNNIRKQDVYRVFAAVSSNVVGQKIAFDFIRNNWEDIKAYMGSSLSNFNTILKFATKRINSKYHLAELKTFVNDDLRDKSRLAQQIIENVQGNVKWMNRNYKTIVAWLRREEQQQQQLDDIGNNKNESTMKN